MSKPDAEDPVLTGTGSGQESSMSTYSAEDVEDSARERSNNPEKPTEQWVTGDEPATGPQESYLGTLAQQAGEEVPSGLTKAEASEEIERLQKETGRGT